MKRYICLACGTIRRAPSVLDGGYPVANDRAEVCPDWPRHCQRPMWRFTGEQYLAAREIPKHLRLPWVAGGLHVLVEQRGRRRCYRAAVWPRDVREALRQAAERDQLRRELEEQSERRNREVVEEFGRYMDQQGKSPGARRCRPVAAVELWGCTGARRGDS